MKRTRSETMKEIWRNRSPEEREAIMAPSRSKSARAKRSASQKLYFSDPEARKRHSLSLQAAWDDPAKSTRMRNGLQRSGIAKRSPYDPVRGQQKAQRAAKRARLKTLRTQLLMLDIKEYPDSTPYERSRRLFEPMGYKYRHSSYRIIKGSA